MQQRRVLTGIGLVLVIGLAALAMTALAQQDTPFRITGAWARPAGVGDMSVVYFRLTNRGEADDRLLSVETEAAAAAEIHTMQMDGDIMRMRPVDGIDIPVGETVVLQPGGMHIMLMGLTEPLAEGDTLILTLVFESGAHLVLTAPVSATPIPNTLDADGLTVDSLAAVQAGVYVGQVVDPPVQVQDFAAPSNSDDITRFSDLDGKWRVIFFGYMHCPDFCPLTLVDYRSVKGLLGDAADDVTFIFISVDAVRDTAAALRSYLANFDPEFVGFSADDVALSRIQPDYGFYYERRLDTGSQAVYTIDHSTRSYLVDRDGVLRASFAYDTAPRAVADALLWYIDRE
jgi:copper(I)-binding protein/peroxiredoxin